MSNREQRGPRTVWGYQGQGTIKEGAGSELRDIPEAQETIEEADSHTRELFDISIADILEKGSLDQLREHQQLIKFVLSAASTAALIKRAKQHPFGVTSHSLGDYAALVAAGVFTLKSGIYLVHERQVAMDKANSEIPGGGGMVGVTGLSAEELEAFATKLDVDVAAVNTDTSGTLSGQRTIIDTVPGHAEEMNGVDAKVLDIDGAAHSRFNEVVARVMEPIMGNVEFNKAKIPFFSGEGSVISDPEEARQYLLRMFYKPVMFRDAVREIVNARVEAFTEVAPTRLLGSFVRRTANRTLDIKTLKDLLPRQEK